MTPAPPGTAVAGTDVLVLDTASLYYRSFYALPSSMRAPDGSPHNAIRGLLNTIERLRERFAPRCLIAAWDEDWRPQWRVDLVPTYKTHRLAEPGAVDEDEPDDLGPQIEAIHEILRAWGVPVLGVAGFEADDVAATVAASAQRQGLSTVIVTGDRDFVQVVGDTTDVLMTVKGGMDAWPLLDVEAVVERFGVLPAQYLDVAALRGDPSDGLPGVRGVGDKTAVRLIQRFGTVQGVLAACAHTPPPKPLTARLVTLITEHAQYLEVARSVSTMRTDVPIAGLDAMLRQPIPATAVKAEAWATVVDDWGVRRFAESALAVGTHSSTGA